MPKKTSVQRHQDEEDDGETVEVPASKRIAEIKLEACLKPKRCGGDRYYGVNIEMGNSSSSAPRDSVEAVVSYIKECLKSYHERDGLILDGRHVQLKNSTSINLSIGQLLSEKSGNLAGFLNVKIKAAVPLEFEKLPDEEIIDAEESDKQDRYEERVLNPLREVLSTTEKACWQFGLPEHNGFDCWGFKEFKEACKNRDSLRPFMDCALAHIKFDMVFAEFKGTMEEWNPDKTNECALHSMQQLKYLKGMIR